MVPTDFMGVLVCVSMLEAATGGENPVEYVLIVQSTPVKDDNSISWSRNFHFAKCCWCRYFCPVLEYWMHSSNV